MKKNLELTEEQLTEITGHLDAVCTTMGMSFRILFSKENEDEIIGFLIGEKELLSGEIEAIEDDGIWTPSQKPEQLN